LQQHIGYHPVAKQHQDGRTHKLSNKVLHSGNLML